MRCHLQRHGYRPRRARRAPVPAPDGSTAAGLAPTPRVCPQPSRLRAPPAPRCLHRHPWPRRRARPRHAGAPPASPLRLLWRRCSPALAASRTALVPGPPVAWPSAPALRHMRPALQRAGPLRSPRGAQLRPLGAAAGATAAPQLLLGHPQAARALTHSRARACWRAWAGGRCARARARRWRARVRGARAAARVRRRARERVRTARAGGRCQYVARRRRRACIGRRAVRARERGARACCWPPTRGRLLLAAYDWPPTTGRVPLAAYRWAPCREGLSACLLYIERHQDGRRARAPPRGPACTRARAWRQGAPSIERHQDGRRMRTRARCVLQAQAQAQPKLGRGSRPIERG